MIDVDIIMLANVEDEHQFIITHNAINTLLRSETNFNFKIKLIESSSISSRYRNYNFHAYENVKVIEPNKPFNYNAFLNIGLEYCDSDFIVFANNDLKFGYCWFSEIYNAMTKHNLGAASPLCPVWWRHRGMPFGVFEGYENGILFSPWCTVYTKEAIEEIKPLDERFSYWYQDDDIIMCLKRRDVRHALVTTSEVEHLGSQSHYLIRDRVTEFCYEPAAIFNQKWFG